MNFKPIFFVSGLLLLVLAGAMMGPLLVDFFNDNDDWKIFAQSGISAAFFGCLLVLANRESEFRLSVRETFLMNFLGWIVAAGFGAVPFCLSSLHFSAAQGFFEAMSGLTTTGLTAVSNLDGQPHGLLLWRAMLHWLGGLGALSLGLAILPLLQVSGMQVFKTQAFDIAKILPSTAQTATYVFLIYLALTLICATLLDYAGLSFFDAACHAMSALSTGGFSTSDISAAKFGSAAVEAILMYFSILAAIPFTLYLRMARGDVWVILKDNQVCTFLGLIAALIFIFTLYLLVESPMTLHEALRHAAFKSVSLFTTSGLTLQDGQAWGPFAVALGFLAALVGGCSGSSAGGLKIFRWQILLSSAKLQIRRLVMPSGIFQAYYNKRTIDAETRDAVAMFALAFAAFCALAGVALMMTGLDFQTAFTTAFAALTNAGPSLTSMVVPAADTTTFGETALWLISACMLLGRLEIFAALVFFAPRFWRH